MLKISSKWISATAALLLVPAFSHTAAGSSYTIASRYISMAIQGDLSGAEVLFEEGYPDDPMTRSLHEQFKNRFHTDAQVGLEREENSFPDVVAHAYREYWRLALLDNSRHPEYEFSLKEKLAGMLLNHRGIYANSTNVFLKLRSELDALGIAYLESPDPPLRDLFLWRNQDSSNYTVQLTDQRIELKVFFMDEFIVQGWKEFASLGLTTTTGWVEDGELYCIAWAYDRDSENFDISYLKHEARHLLDLDLYPDMDSTELEYRAKLTELAFANLTVTRILNDFAAKAAENAESPHALANWRVVRDVHWELHGTEMPPALSTWGYVDAGKVNRVARRLLKSSSDRHVSN